MNVITLSPLFAASVTILAAVIGSAVVALGAVYYALKLSKDTKKFKEQIDKLNRGKERLEEQKREVQDQKQQIEGRLRKMEWDTLPRLREELQDIKTKGVQKHLQDQQKKLEKLSEDQKQEIEKLRSQMDAKEQQLKASLATREAQLKLVQQESLELGKQIDEGVDFDAHLWNRPFDEEAPKFEPLLTRYCPIISVINLAGNVGKGTLTANLGITLGAQDKSVLMIDLDTKRSLTYSLCRGNMPELLSAEHRTIQHFFLWPNPDVRFLFNGLMEVENAQKCHVLVNSDKINAATGAEPDLQEAEMQLLGKWLGDSTSEDVRFFLRVALHAAEIRQRYDYVLLNCPPRLSPGCINALTASDFVIIPTLLTNTSMRATHNVLRKIRDLQSTRLLQDLRLLGIVANYTAAADSKSWPQAQQDFWKGFQESTKQVWGEDVPFFETAIPSSASVETAKANQQAGQPQGCFAAQYQDLQGSFANLVKEMEDRIEQERRQLAKVS